MRLCLTSAALGLLVPGLLLAQTSPPYTDRAAMAASQAFQARVGVAAQQQAIVAMGENPDVCCQATTQSTMALKPGTTSLCAVKITGGTPGASDLVKARSRERHQARLRFASQVFAQPGPWAASLAGIVASDACIPLDVTDAALQSYLVNLWDVVALPPELANAIVVTTPTVSPVPPPPTVKDEAAIGSLNGQWLQWRQPGPPPPRGDR